MVTITDAAAEKIKEILEAEGKAGWGLRIYTAGSGCCGPSYGMDIEEKAEDGDDVLEKNGLKVFMDKATSKSLDNMQIDYISTEEAEGFVIRGGSPSCSCESGSCED